MNPISRRTMLLRAGFGAIAFSVQKPTRSEVSNSSLGHLAKPSLSPMDKVAKSFLTAWKENEKNFSFYSQKTMGLLLMTENGLVAMTVPGNALILDENKLEDDPNRTVPAYLYFHHPVNPSTKSFNLWILNPANNQLLQLNATNDSDAFTVLERKTASNIVRHGKKNAPAFPPPSHSLVSNPNFTVVNKHAEPVKKNVPIGGGSVEEGNVEAQGSVETTVLYKPGEVENALNPLVRSLGENQLPHGVSIITVNRDDDGKKMVRYNAGPIENFFVAASRQRLTDSVAIAYFPFEGKQISPPTAYDWEQIKEPYLKRQMELEPPPTLLPSQRTARPVVLPMAPQPSAASMPRQGR